MPRRCGVRGEIFNDARDFVVGGANMWRAGRRGDKSLKYHRHGLTYALNEESSFKEITLD